MLKYKSIIAFLLVFLSLSAFSLGEKITGIQIEYSIDTPSSAKSFWKGKRNGNKQFETKKGLNIVRHSWGDENSISNFILKWRLPPGEKIIIHRILLGLSSDTLTLKGADIVHWFDLSEGVLIDDIKLNSLILKTIKSGQPPSISISTHSIDITKLNAKSKSKISFLGRSKLYSIGVISITDSSKKVYRRAKFLILKTGVMKDIEIPIHGFSQNASGKIIKLSFKRGVPFDIEFKNISTSKHHLISAENIYSSSIPNFGMIKSYDGENVNFRSSKLDSLINPQIELRPIWFEQLQNYVFQIQLSSKYDGIIELKTWGNDNHYMWNVDLKKGKNNLIIPIIMTDKLKGFDFTILAKGTSSNIRIDSLSISTKEYHKIWSNNEIMSSFIVFNSTEMNNGTISGKRSIKFLLKKRFEFMHELIIRKAFSFFTLIIVAMFFLVANKLVILS